MAREISAEEREMMRDAYRYLSKYIDPPAKNDSRGIAWWDMAIKEYGQLVSEKWANHPLIVEIMYAITTYLEIKAKEKVRNGKTI